MPTPADLPLTWPQVAAFRLARHHLLDRAPEGSLVSVAGDIAGVQAQLLSAAQIGLWARVRDLQMEDADQALSERSLVKAACMRHTLFLVPGNELAVFVRGSARRAEKDIRWTLGKGVSERTVAAVVDAALNVLDQPRTRPEIADLVCRGLGVQPRAIHGGVGWGNRKPVDAVPVGDIDFPVVYLLNLVSARGVYCYGPNRGSEPTFVRADAWIPGWQDLPQEQAEVALLHKYLRAFAPATAADFALWSGMTLSEARLLWARMREDLALVDVEGWQASVLREDLDALAQPGLRAPVRLLPYFDTFLLGHKQRDHLAANEHHPQIYRPQGWIAPVVLVDGRAAGVWESAREGDVLRVKVTPFTALSPSIAAGIEEEARDLARFLGMEPVEVTSVGETR